MSHPATSIRGITFVQNVGTPQESSHTKASVPLLRRRLEPGAKTDIVVREFNLAMEDLHAATLGSRSIPFGGPIVILQGISFTNGTPIALAHRLKSAKAMLLFLANPQSLASGGVPLVTVTGVDDSNLTLSPLGTFTADVVLGLGP